MSSQVIPVNVQVPSDPTGPVIADLTVEALRVAYVARRDLERLSEGEWGVPGIYVLLTDDGSGQVYVGQAVHVRKRLLQHRSKPKLGWARAVAIKRDTTHGFNSAEIGYLEGRLAAELGAVPGVNVVESLKSHDTTLPSHHMLALDALLPGVFAALRLASMDLFKDADLPDTLIPEVGGGRSHTVIPGTVADLVGAGLLRAGAELRLSQGGRLASATVSTSGELIVNGVAWRPPCSGTRKRPSGCSRRTSGLRGTSTTLSGPTLAQLRAKLRPNAAEVADA